MSVTPRVAAVLCLIAMFSVTAQADEVLMKNGDRLTGKITSMTGGNLVIETEMSGTVTVPFANIATFSSDEPLDLRTVDGQLLKAKVSKSDTEGSFNISNANLLDQTLPMDQVDAINPPPVEWSGNVVLGAEIDAGNVEEREYTVRVDGTRRSDDDRISFRGAYAGERTKSGGRWVSTKREVNAGLTYDYFLSDQWFVWAGLSAEKDGIADLSLRLIAGAGAGYQWFETDDLKLDTRAGLTWVSEDYDDTTPDDSYVGGLVGWNYEQRLLESVVAFSNGEWIPSLEDGKDHYVKAIAGFRNDITGSLYGEASVLYEWDSTPANSAERTDVTYLLGLGWSF